MAKRVKATTKAEQAFISQKIKKLKAEGKTQEQAVGAAFGFLRQRRKKK